MLQAFLEKTLKFWNSINAGRMKLVKGANLHSRRQVLGLTSLMCARSCAVSNVSVHVGSGEVEERNV